MLNCVTPLKHSTHFYLLLLVEVCGTLPNIEHGQGILTDITVVYKCDEDFVLIGNEIIECQLSGNWSQPPTCLFGMNLSYFKHV